MIHKIYKIGDGFVEADLARGIKIEVQHISLDNTDISQEIDISEDDQKKLNRLKTRKSRDKMLNDIIKDKENN